MIDHPACSNLRWGNLFTAQDKLYAQWAVIVKDTNELTEKSLHCITVDDALKLIRLRRRIDRQHQSRCSRARRDCGYRRYRRCR